MVMLSALVLPAVLAAASSSPASDAAPPAAHSNVSITLTVGRTGGPSGSADRIYKVLGQEGSPTRMLVGWRTPIPTRSSDEKSGEPSSTSYVYQNVGVGGTFETQALGGGRLLVAGQIEISGAREASAAASSGGKPPLIGTFQQDLRVVVRSGEKLRVAEAPDPDGGTLYIDLRVDLLE